MSRIKEVNLEVVNVEEKNLETEVLDHQEEVIEKPKKKTSAKPKKKIRGMIAGFSENSTTLLLSDGTYKHINKKLGDRIGLNVEFSE